MCTFVINVRWQYDYVGNNNKYCKKKNNYGSNESINIDLRPIHL